MKIVLIGAGSYVFAPSVVEDLLIKSRMTDFEFVMLDINLTAAQLMADAASAVARELGLKVSVSATDSRETALPNADYVVTSIAVQGAKRWLMDYDVCKSEGIPDLLRENGAIGGITYSLRNSTLLLSICRDMERLCPKAILLNVSNPLTKNQTTIFRYTTIKSFGFCNVVYGGSEGYQTIARYLGCQHTDLDVLTAGINHFAWVVSVKDKSSGRDLSGELIEKVSASEDGESQNLIKLYRKFGMLPASPVGHHAEYLPPMENVFYEDRPPYHGDENERQSRISSLESLANGKLGHAEVQNLWGSSWEHPGLVAAALTTGSDYYLPALNVPNDGCLPQLPEGNIVEVPVTISGGKAVSAKGITFAPEVARILCEQSRIAELIAQCTVEGSRELAHRIVDEDNAIDSKAPAHRALDRILDHHLDILPQFSR